MTKPLKPATETAKPIGLDYNRPKIDPNKGSDAPTIDYKALKVKEDNTPAWKKKWAGTPPEAKRALVNRMGQARMGMEKSKGASFVDGALAKWKAAHEAKQREPKEPDGTLFADAEAPAEKTESKVDKVPFEPSQEPITIEDGYKKRNVKKTADKGAEMLRTLRATKAKKKQEMDKSAKKSESDTLEKGQNGDWEKEGYELHPYGNDEPSIEISHKGVPLKGGMHTKKMSDGTLKVTSVMVPREHQRKGLATAMYAHAEKMTGKKIAPSDAQTPEGKALWTSPNRKFGKSDDLSKAGSFRKKTVPSAEKLLDKWKVKPMGKSVDIAKEKAKMHEPDYNTQVNQKVASVKAAHKDHKEPSLDSQVSNVKDKYKQMHKSESLKGFNDMKTHKKVGAMVGVMRASKLSKDMNPGDATMSQSPQLDPAGVASIKGAFGKSADEGSALARWKAKQEQKRTDKAGQDKPAMDAHKHAKKRAQMIPNPDLGKSFGVSETVHASSSAPKMATPKMPKVQTIKTVGPAPVQKSWEVEGEVPIEKSKGAFKRLESKLESEGKSKKSAGAIAAAVGDKAYGKKTMEVHAKAGTPVEKSWKVEGEVPMEKSKKPLGLTHQDTADYHRAANQFHDATKGGQPKSHKELLETNIASHLPDHVREKAAKDGFKSGSMKKSEDLTKSEWKSPAHSCHGKLAVMLNKMRGTSPKAMDKSQDDGQPDMASEQLTEIATHLQEILATGALGEMNDDMKSKLTLANDYLSTLAHYLQSEPELHGAVTDLIHNGSSGTEQADAPMAKDMNGGMDPNMGGMDSEGGM